jgi:hypothetical protein
MDWVWIIAIWIGLAMLTGSLFHAMVTIRDMETTTFDDDDPYEIDRGRDI